MMGRGGVCGLETSMVGLASHTAGTRHSYNVTRTCSGSVHFLFCFLFMLFLFFVRFPLGWGKMTSESPRFTYVPLSNPCRKKEYRLLSNSSRSLWTEWMTCIFSTWSSPVECGQGVGNDWLGPSHVPTSRFPWIKMAPLTSHRSRINKGQVVIPQFSF